MTDATKADVQAAKPEIATSIETAQAINWARSYAESKRTLDFAAVDVEVAQNLRAARAILQLHAENEALKQASAWLPIESAPHRQNVLVGWRNPLGKWRCMKACYFEKDQLDSEHTDSGYAPEGWYEASESNDELAPLLGDQTPTNWQPLPTPPEPKRD